MYITAGIPKWPLGFQDGSHLYHMYWQYMQFCGNIVIVVVLVGLSGDFISLYNDLVALYVIL